MCDNCECENREEPVNHCPKVTDCENDDRCESCKHYDTCFCDCHYGEPDGIDLAKERKYGKY